MSHSAHKGKISATLIVVSLVTGWSEVPAVGTDHYLKMKHLVKCVSMMVYSGCLCSEGCP